MRAIYSYLQLAVLVMIGISSVFFFEFTAEDAYITYRYAENWIDHGSLVYNQGEPINAMTSPLHAVLSAAMYFATRDTVLSNKIFALVLLLLSAGLVWNRFRKDVHVQALTVILLIPSCVLLWTFGGLETPILLFLATLTVMLALRTPPLNLSFLCAIFFLAGLGFLTRYDSILFFLPITLYAAAKAQSKKQAGFAFVAAAILPLAWLFVSIKYYGDLLPTSFYVKTPDGNLGGIFINGKYIASYLLYIGVIPTLVLVILLLLPKRTMLDTLYGHFTSLWWLYTGLFLEVIYGLTMATHHMMFSFRFFVPYIPSTVILVADLLRRALETGKVDVSSGKPAYLFTGFLLSLAVFQLYQNVYTYRHSVNGIAPTGEYGALGIRDYVVFIEILKQEAIDIERHWGTINADSGRDPRIITFAAGMLPYTYKHSYIYEKLVSYRHCHQRYRQGLYADYLHILAPRQGTVDNQLPRSEDTYDLVSSYEMTFDGSKQKFLVYYNPTPEAHNLSAGIFDPCNQSTQAAN